MGEAEQQILQMLEDGIISAEEADNLLRALHPEEDVEIISSDTLHSQEIVAEEPIPPQSVAAPKVERFRRFWRIPLFIAAGSLLISGLGLILLYQSADDIAALGFLCIWSIFILALLATAFFFIARRSLWLHLRVQEKDGRRITISLPMPLRMTGWILNVARRFVPKDQAMHLETAATFLTVMRDNPDQEPIIIDVDDDDGDKVQIYIG